MNGVTSMDQVIVRKLTELIHSNLDKLCTGKIVMGEQAFRSKAGRIGELRNCIRQFENKTGVIIWLL